MKERIIEFMTVFLGVRKFVAWSFLFVIAIIFRLKGYVDGAQFVDLSKATFLGFVAGNSVEHFANTAKSYLDSKTSDQKEVADSDVEISA